METKILLKLSFIISLIGLFSLILLAEYINPEPKALTEIMNNPKAYLDQEISVIGIIANIREFDSGDVFFDLKQNTQSILIKGSFSYGDLNYFNLTEDKRYIITGKFQEYNSSFFIEAKSIKFLETNDFI